MFEEKRIKLFSIFNFLYIFSKKSKTNFMKKEEIYQLSIGFFTGIVSGLFASGGGMILVPAFIYILKISEVEARATSVLCILPMVVTSGIFYYTNNYIDWKIGILCAIGGIAGGVLGAKLLNKLSIYYLKIVFILFLIYASYRMVWS